MRRAPLLAALVLVGLAACAAPRRLRRGGDTEGELLSAPPSAEAPWIELTKPAEAAALEGTIGLVLVGGKSGAGPHGPQDIVLTIDMSGSVFEPSGVDFDGDGIVGRWLVDRRGYPLYEDPKLWTTDFDDVVLKIEVSAAKQLVALLDPRTTRIGLVKFGDTAHVERSVGDVAAVADDLESFRYVMRGGTDIVAGIEQSIELLESAPPRAEAQRTVLLLTDGELEVELRQPLLGQYIDQVLEHARRSHVRVFTFGVGSRAEDNSAFLHALAYETGGRHVSVASSPSIAVELPLVSLTGLSDVELWNETTHAGGRAVRVFPDGSFDGYVPLAEGSNTLRATATLDDGRTVETRVRVNFHHASPPTAQQTADGEALLGDLRNRSVETDFAVRAQEERRKRRLHSLEVSPADPNARSAPAP